MITSKSLHHSNVVLAFDERTFPSPENAVITSAYTGEEGRGARFLDDPLIHAKVLTLPNIGIKLTLEGIRARIDDESKAEPNVSRLAQETARIYQSIFNKGKLTAYGFNYEMYYRFNNLIPLEYIFSGYFSKDALSGATLKDVGIQFTLNRKHVDEIWYIKVTAPLEVAAHINVHIPASELPGESELKRMFEKQYADFDLIMGKFNPWV